MPNVDQRVYFKRSSADDQRSPYGALVAIKQGLENVYVFAMDNLDLRELREPGLRRLWGTEVIHALPEPERGEMSKKVGAVTKPSNGDREIDGFFLGRRSGADANGYTMFSHYKPRMDAQARVGCATTTTTTTNTPSFPFPLMHS